MKTLGKIPNLKASLTAAVALAALLPVSALLAGETTVTPGAGDTATVRAGGKEITINSRGTVKTQDCKVVKTPEAAQMKIGQFVPGKGIYAGQWKPEGLSQTFNLYADTRDLGVMNFEETVRRTAGLSNHHGHNGFNHNVAGMSPEGALFKALRDGTYKGEWFIPPVDAVKENLYENREDFERSRAFVTGYRSGTAEWYWSLTELLDNSSRVAVIGFTDGVGTWAPKGKLELSLRLVRAEPAP